jgi:hypothetical protein
VESQEQLVGPFRADILCRDTISSNWVLIENQLERTDHVHLGQLLTYAAGLDAVTIIWVASQFTEQHRAALDWLNHITSTGINFFGLEIELWRIGDSPMAPKFNVISQPNDWSKSVKEQAAIAQAGELTGFQRLHLEFWTQFRQYLEDRQSPIRTGIPSKESWTTIGLGRTNFVLMPWNRMQDNRSGVALELTGPHAKSHFHLLQQRHRQLVEEKLAPLGTLDWRLMPESKASQISLEREMSTPSKPETWAALNVWMAGALETMHSLFRPIVKSLNAAEYVADSSAGGTELEKGLQALANLLPAFESPDFKFGEWGDSQSGTITVPYAQLSDEGQRFIDTVDSVGWVMTDFDWSEWSGSEECERLRYDTEALEKANAEQLRRLVTAVVRADHFNEGALLDTWESGLLLRVLRRARALLDDGV